MCHVISVCIYYAGSVVIDFRLATLQDSFASTDSLIKAFESTIRKFPNCAEGYALFGQVRAYWLYIQSPLTD